MTKRDRFMFSIRQVDGNEFLYLVVKAPDSAVNVKSVRFDDSCVSRVEH